MNRSEVRPAMQGFAAVRAALDQMNQPGEAARAHALFAEVMAKLEQRRRRRQRARRIMRTIGAVLAATGAGAYRILAP
jgi:hypothetical protein